MSAAISTIAAPSVASVTSDSALHPDLQQLLAFYLEQRAQPPEEYVHRAGVIPKPSFFSIASLQRHLNNPLLHPDWLALVSRGQLVPLEQMCFYKLVQQKRLFFMDKRVIEEHLQRGASVVLEGLDVLDPAINAFTAGLDAGLPCSLVNAAAFFSQRGNEAYRGHLDVDDVLVIQLAGEKRWELFARQPARRSNLTDLSREQMGRKIADVVMRPGDALYVRACVPHICETPGSHSLHLSFDLCDRTPQIDQMLLTGVERYFNACAAPYTPAPEVLDKYAALLLSAEFKDDMLKRTRQTHAEAAAFRQRIGGTSPITALNKFTVMSSS